MTGAPAPGPARAGRRRGWVWPLAIAGALAGLVLAGSAPTAPGRSGVAISYDTGEPR